MENFKDLKKQEYSLNDEELDYVTGGMKTFSMIGTDSTKHTTVMQNDDGGTNTYRCSICNSHETMNYEDHVAHIKTVHPEEYHYIP